MSDDHAAHALSCYGSAINTTPSLDRLAREGMRFDRAFVTNSICTPSRASILTGKYSHANGTPVFNKFDGTQWTVAKALQAAGYHTGMIGKWHLGGEPTGFDEWTILPGQGRYRDPVMLDRNGRSTRKGYATDVITQLGLAFLEKRPQDRPFFLMLHHKAPHREWTPDERHAHLFDGVDVKEPATLRDDWSTRTDAARETTMTIEKHLTERDLKGKPPAGLSGDALLRWKYQRFIKDYLGCVAGVDDSVGRVLAWLDEHGLRENTLVVYTSDNGFFLGDHGWYDKRFMYEPSLRVPLLVRWPARVPGGAATAAMALNVDYAPTLLAAAGVEVPPEVQGKSLVPLLSGTAPAGWRKSFYYRYYHDPGDHNTRAHLGVRTETHKLIWFWKKDQWELYDLVADPDELHNLHGDSKQAALVTELQRELFRLKQELGDTDQFALEPPPQGVDR
jgi:arylsulfatase A-like enzyme